MGRNASQLLDEAETKVMHIAEAGSRGRKQYAKVGDLLVGVVERIEELFSREHPSDVTGIATGFADLDRLTAGLQPGDLVIVAGAPSMGKTALAVNMGEHVALDQKRPVAIFSMEMGANQLALRLIASVGRLQSNNLRTGKLQADDWTRCRGARPPQRRADPDRRDAGADRHGAALARAAHRARARAARPRHRRLPAAHAGVVAGREPRDRDLRDLALAQGAREGAAGAGDRAVAAQPLARAAPEQAAGDERPRGVGAIEQDADVILFIYRDEVYNEDTPDKGVAEIIIAKQRNGPIGTVRLTFLGEFTRFENFAAPGSY
jgi:replicative DNA helicase